MLSAWLANQYCIIFGASFTSWRGALTIYNQTISLRPRDSPQRSIEQKIQKCTTLNIVEGQTCFNHELRPQTICIERNYTVNLVL